MANCSSCVEIGYLEKPEESWILESRFFPSKVGGKPAWLDLKNISVDLNCGECCKPCIFLCQVYAPIESDEDNAYRRSIYVFVCKNPECNKVAKSDNFKVLRCQLPRINNFYVPDEPSDEVDWHQESKIENFNKICEVCGCLGVYQCGKCKVAKYCSREHQILSWKMGHNKMCSTDNSNIQITFHNSNILFPEYEIIIEQEEIADDNHSKTNETEESEERRMMEFNELIKNGKGGTLQDTLPEVLEKYALTKEDKYLKNFKLKLNNCPDQVLRYHKGGEPLWIQKPNLKEDNIPKCEYCNGPRQFEFQILPTLLNYLDVDQLSKSLDWGNLLIYTCKNNCANGPAYKNEFLWKQDIQ